MAHIFIADEVKCDRFLFSTYSLEHIWLCVQFIHERYCLRYIHQVVSIDPFSDSSNQRSVLLCPPSPPSIGLNSSILLPSGSFQGSVQSLALSCCVQCSATDFNMAWFPQLCSHTIVEMGSSDDVDGNYFAVSARKYKTANYNQDVSADWIEQNEGW